MNRREFLKMLPLVILFPFSISGKSRERRKRLRRPPGGHGLEELCIKCGRCIDSCPYNALEPYREFWDLKNFGTPHLVRKCYFPICGHACAKACPTGAIRRI
ncbi:hypothetical protein DRN52_01770 [Thermococci archaeon]|nr:MAG: hypothetical protein DRN52_01770 [Thermococci archaeon]